MIAFEVFGETRLAASRSLGKIAAVLRPALDAGALGDIVDREDVGLRFSTAAVAAIGGREAAEALARRRLGVGVAIAVGATGLA